MASKLEEQTIDVPVRGLGQEMPEIVRKPGTLEFARNVEFDRAGRLRKRKGYAYVDINAVSPYAVTPVNDTYSQVATFKDELVVFGRDHVYAISSPEAAVTDQAYTCVLRGTYSRLALSVEYVSQGMTPDEDGGL